MSLNNDRAALVFSGLGHDRRLEIFRLLVQAGFDGATPGKIKDRASISASTLSFHLRILKEIDLVQVTREGRTLVYRANFSLINEAMAYLLANCCQGSLADTPASSI